MAYKRKDGYFRRAQREGYAARSIYKLEAIDQRFQLLRSRSRVLDLGCAPGSWLQYLIKAVGPEGLVVGVDLQPIRIELPSYARFIQRDIFDLSLEDYSPTGERFDVIVSDMAPRTTGHRDVDQQRSADLVAKTLRLCDALLAPGGSWVAKGFQGQALEDLVPQIRSRFERFERLRPPATRKNSFEIFFIGKGFRQLTPEPEAAGAETEKGWSPSL